MSRRKKKNIKINDVWFVKYPYVDDNSVYKDRPAIVIDKDEKGLYVVLKCTSKSPKVKYDYSVRDAKVSNIVDTGCVKCNNEGHIARRHFRRKIGEVSAYDMKKITQKHIMAKADGKVQVVKLEQFFMDDDEFEAFMEAKLSSDERTDFGIPELKKYPMPDANHVRSAVAYFNKVDKGHEAELANNIIKYMHKYKMDDIKVSPSNRFSKYYTTESVSFFEEAASNRTKFADMKKVYDTLSDKEKSYLGNKFIDSPASVFRKVAYKDGTPVAFIDIYNFSRQEIIIEFAVVPDARRYGVATKLIKVAIDYLVDHPEYRRIVYLVKKDNEASIKLAEANGFTKTNEDKNSNHYVYEYKADYVDIDELDDDMLDESAKLSDVKTPRDLNKILNSYKYGYVIHGKPYEGDDFSKYTTLSPEQFAKYKIGVCWDYVAYEYWYFKKYFKYPVQLYYIEGDNGNKSHTWLTYTDNGSVYAFESSWKSYQGIHKFKDVNDMSITYSSKFAKTCKTKGLIMYKMTQIDEYGLDPNTYMDRILRDCIANKCKVLESDNYFTKRIKPFMESCAAVGGAMVGMDVNDQSVCATGCYVINYGMRNTFIGDDYDGDGQALANDIISDKVLMRRNGKTVSEDNSVLDDRKITMFKYTGPRENFNKILRDVGKVSYDYCDETYFFEMLTGKEMLTELAIIYNENFEVVNPFRMQLKMGAVLETMLQKHKVITEGGVHYFPSMSKTDRDLEQALKRQDENLRLLTDINGYFVYNEATRLRTKSVPLDFIKKAYQI